MRRSQSLKQPNWRHAASALRIIMSSAYIPRGLVKVFDKVRRHIKGSDRKCRTEAFLEWVEENPGEVYAIQERDAQREIARAVREHGRGEGRSEVPF